MPVVTPFPDPTGLRDRLPQSVRDLLDALAVNPVSTVIPAAGVAEPMLRSLGKPVSDLLGLVLSPTQKGSGLPNRLRLTQWNNRSGNLEFHGQGPRPLGVERFEATPGQVDTLIRGNALDLEQPSESAVASIRRKLARLLNEQD